MSDHITIAIDGPAASGKGTISKRIAAHLGLRHLDTGLLYRAVAALCVDQGVFPTDAIAAAGVAQDLSMDDLARDNLRDADIGRLASVVAAHPPVREALLQWQRGFAAAGAVLDGRDIGTVVLPNANAKLYITASLDARAERRWKELNASSPITLEAVRDEIEERDTRDARRTDAPMARAEDADLLDTTEMDIEQAVAEALRLVGKQLKAARR